MGSARADLRWEVFFFLQVLFLIFIQSGFVLGEDKQIEEAPKIWVVLPLLDSPFNFSDRYAFPSMKQSLSISTGAFQVSNYGVQQHIEHSGTLGRGLSWTGYHLLVNMGPFGYAWLHEEWHRAVMNRRGIHSFNTTYFFGQKVNQVSDEDLIRLKLEHPQEVVRLSSAGIEANNEANLQLEKETFFFDSPSWNTPQLWINYGVGIYTFFVCSGPRSDKATDSLNKATDASVESRDFTGLDPTAWVYDLFRPGEPYQGRGINPSGIGINRYRKFSDLNSEEQKFIQDQAVLSWTNLLDPNLLGFQYFTGSSPFSGREFRWNMTARHHMTSFGHTLDGNVFIRQSPWNLLFIVHNYFNHERYFPGLETQILRYPISWLDRSFKISGRLAIWEQPASQEFRASPSAPGALASLTIAYAYSPTFEPYLEIERKSAGWVAGNVYLDPNTSFAMGLNLGVF